MSRFPLPFLAGVIANGLAGGVMVMVDTHHVLSLAPTGELVGIL
jgi:hypothetical protein